jgi:hypothetical protein
MQHFSETCHCGRVFSQTYAFTNHERTCKKSKKRLSDALAKAKQIYQAKKRRVCVPDAEVDASTQRDAIASQLEPTAGFGTTVRAAEPDVVVPEPDIHVRCAAYFLTWPHHNMKSRRPSSQFPSLRTTLVSQ